MVLRGEAGFGKSALLGYVSDRVAGWRVATAVGIESEMELDYSGLHQLCAPILQSIDRIPAPQRDALATVFGRHAGPAPDRFMVGLATLTLLAVTADEQPLVCIVDDAQWLDDASAQILGFVARRLLAERIALVCALRAGSGHQVLAGLPELSIDGLGESDARALLLANVHGPLDPAVCDQIIAESRGNPLALLELPRTWNTAELAGGFGLPESHSVVNTIEQSYARRLVELPPESHLLVLAAAAEPLGDLVLFHRAAATLDIDLAAVGPAVDAGLLQIEDRVEFAHPLARSAAYRSAAVGDRQRVHRALADATDPETDPDRHAWHRARAASGPDEGVASELERSAARAQARGGLAAAAAFLQRAVALTLDPSLRAERALAAAQASLQAGNFNAAIRLLATAEAGPPDVLRRARVDLIRGHLAFGLGRGNDAPTLLFKAAIGFEPFDVELARDTYLMAWGTAVNSIDRAGELAVREISRAVRALPQAASPRPRDLLLDGLALLTTDGTAAATPALQRAARALVSLPLEDVLAWGFLALGASIAVWDEEGMLAIPERHVRLLRDAGALGALPIHLQILAITVMWFGDLSRAASLIAEAESIAAATGSRHAPAAMVRLLVLRGREAEAAGLIKATIKQAEEGGQGSIMTTALWAAATLYNGLARYEEAASWARQASSNTFEPWNTTWALIELVEAAAREGETKLARDALERLAARTQPSGTDFGLGIEARCRALVSVGDAAEELYCEAIERLGRTRLRPELARAQLLYGEWLRREGRSLDARRQLRTAHDMLDAIGMEAFAARASRELVATGAKRRKRVDEMRDSLTPQEQQVAWLAREGLSNPEIGTRLFLSPRTVEWHLGKVFDKLGITSRVGLHTALPMRDRDAALP